ncbi:hypothetical protein L9F63_019031, partial [Diploptera punctata]
ILSWCNDSLGILKFLCLFLNSNRGVCLFRGMQCLVLLLLFLDSFSSSRRGFKSRCGALNKVFFLVFMVGVGLSDELEGLFGLPFGFDVVANVAAACFLVGRSTESERCGRRGRCISGGCR